MMRYFKKVLLTVVTLSLGMISLITTAETLDRIVAVVNDTIISQQQLNRQIELSRQKWQAENKTLPPAATFRRDVLNDLIDNELQRQLAKATGLKLDEASLDKTILDIANRNQLTLTQLRDQLAQANIPYAEYRHKIAEQVMLDRLQQAEVGAKITVSAREITNELAHSPEVDQHTLYHFEDLLVPLPDNPSVENISTAKKTALLLRQQAKKGLSFKDLIEQPSNAASMLSGGDLGWRQINQLPDLFQPHITRLTKGRISLPIQAKNGFHLLHLIEQRHTSTKPVILSSVHARHILIKTSPLVSNAQAEKRLKAIRAEILQGGHFAELAKKYSQDPASAFKGGDLGWMAINNFEPVFAAQLNKLRLNQLSQPFQTSFGWHLAEILAKKTERQTQQALFREQAAQRVYQKKFQQARKLWLQHLRQQAYIHLEPN